MSRLGELPTLLAAATAGPWAIDDSGAWRAFMPGVPSLYVGEFDGSAHDERFVLALVNSAPQLIAAARFVEEHGETLAKSLRMLWCSELALEAAKEALAKLRAGGT